MLCSGSGSGTSKSKTVYTYERDIICLPNWFKSEGELISKKRSKNFLVLHERKIVYMQLEEALTVEEMCQMLDSNEFNFRYDINVSDLSNNLQRERVVASHYVVVGVKAQLDQIVTGFFYGGTGI
jgi:hypothetical protein